MKTKCKICKKRITSKEDIKFLDLPNGLGNGFVHVKCLSPEIMGRRDI